MQHNKIKSPPHMCEAVIFYDDLIKLVRPFYA